MFNLCKQFGLNYDGVNTGVRGNVQVIKFQDVYDFYILNEENKWQLFFSSLTLEQIIFVLQRFISRNLWSKRVKKTKDIQPLLACNLNKQLLEFFPNNDRKLRSVYYSFAHSNFSSFDGELIVGANLKYENKDYFLEIYQFIHSLHSSHSLFIHDNTFIHNHSLSYHFIIHHYIFNSYNMIHDKIYTFIDEDRNRVMREFQKFLEQNCVEDFQV